MLTTGSPFFKLSVMKPNIAVVGVGRMGANMARRIKDLGYPVVAVYDARPEVTKELAGELGCAAVDTLAAVTAVADIILTVVTDDAAMRGIFASSGDSLLVAAEGKLFINCATCSPAVHEEIFALCDERGASSLEACMASSITQAREGTLYLMIGGRESDYQKAEELLRGLSSALRYVGGVGQAAKVKALVNMVMNINTAGLAEGLGLGAALGLDLQMLKEVFSQTGANARVLQTDGDDMIAREHDCYFSAAHAAKDSGIANDLATAAGVAVPLSVATEAQYRKMITAGLGELDKSGIAELTFPGRLN
jgi:3-hydroxyisobutyrate dehydrogenase-like beta-hydroxyacid dehydrogenase